MLVLSLLGSYVYIEAKPNTKRTQCIKSLKFVYHCTQACFFFFLIHYATMGGPYRFLPSVR